MFLRHLATESRNGMAPLKSFEDFRNQHRVRILNWPDDVVQQWLHDHAANESFLSDYGALDLRTLRWNLEVVPLATWLDMPTGASDRGSIEEFSEDPEHWIRQRRHGEHIGVAETWRAHGTWKRWPLCIERSLLPQPGAGLQLIEGRTRVGVLRGLHQRGQFVASEHLAWVARAAA